VHLPQYRGRHPTPEAEWSRAAGVPDLRTEKRVRPPEIAYLKKTRIIWTIIPPAEFVGNPHYAGPRLRGSLSLDFARGDSMRGGGFGLVKGATARPLTAGPQQSADFPHRLFAAAWGLCTLGIWRIEVLNAGYKALANRGSPIVFGKS
jgi:hypothetical protein